MRKISLPLPNWVSNASQKRGILTNGNSVQSCMPPIKLSNHEYVTGVIEGSIKVSRYSNDTIALAHKTDWVKVIQVSQIKGLTIYDIASFENRKSEIPNYVPICKS